MLKQQHHKADQEDLNELCTLVIYESDLQRVTPAQTHRFLFQQLTLQGTVEGQRRYLMFSQPSLRVKDLKIIA